MSYLVNTESLLKNFPVGFVVPELLIDFANWLKDNGDVNLGYFSLQSDRFNDFWIENGADLHPKFAFFMRDCTGGNIGFWHYDGIGTSCSPIVLFGSEGELQIISDTLEEFFAMLADGKTGVHDLDSRDQDGKDATELGKWLEFRTIKPPMASLRKHPDLNQWMEAWYQQQRDWINKNTLHLELADRLRKYVKSDAQPWDTANFDVLLVGTQFKIWHRSFGLKPLPASEIAQLERLFISVREQRAKYMPERGLWFSAWVNVGTQGGANICCNFMEEPVFLDERPMIPDNDYERDLKAFPRSTHWMPDWLIKFV